ncbi:MAG TPA: 23S rRNA (adenine(2503)-C(2))-methyltransferase RlmN [Anaerohalosphaeraceae bacterium]|nr:23S rRNA (adenine(2503)-C(2))-methyltransferase RlmN [Anaerohalosphaeraceae bacterium]HPC65112.1 23S rRNA (adenine(2503)-C(2))-methyltransferase RlmN [Anaerohalosphaeraceae bacterium]HPO71007.1 23S rRNA (adenine(2503)-C(2))-methyltransferase RlmN [Anaerohalosphaeraceae bacterium]HRS72347.1 23S rRNA (adenine(2503)-C(2))-methyltransferase RlmN [Anaerohalosphaeraceae bacterium]HRV19230.1 23S rRNA (adenine(2503)-C(2))-methyltransferase RlmN [Anaerohalosphaeraceae bacterium]
MDRDLKNRTHHELSELAAAYGQKPFAADYLFSFIHQKDAEQISAVSPLSKQFRQKLADEGFFIGSIGLLEQQEDPDGTVKFVFGMADGVRIESVRLKDGRRNTLCISTQAGCRMGCRFCATGQLPYRRNLTAGEIADQVYKAEALVGRIDNVVYMGMGEPLDNYDNVMRSVEILNDKCGRNIGIRHITISTCGLPEAIQKLAKEKLRPRLAVSLHAASDAVRSKLMRIGQKYPLSALLASLKTYQSITGSRITVEYCMIAGVNDQPEQAAMLIKLLRPLKVNVNLIELNAFPGCRFEASPSGKIQAFADMLADAGIETVIRFKRGRKIKAACGQLGADWLQKQSGPTLQGT